MRGAGLGGRGGALAPPTAAILSFRYLHERFGQLQEEVNLLKSNMMKYKVGQRHAGSVLLS